MSKYIYLLLVGLLSTGCANPADVNAIAAARDPSSITLQKRLEIITPQCRRVVEGGSASQASLLAAGAIHNTGDRGITFPYGQPIETPFGVRYYNIALYITDMQSCNLEMHNAVYQASMIASQITREFSANGYLVRQTGKGRYLATNAQRKVRITLTRKRSGGSQFFTVRLARL